MLASTIQFSHNTPHQPTTMHTASRLPSHVWVDNQGIMPQTPNNAPSTFINVLVNQPTGYQSFWLRCISTRLNNRWQQNFCLLNHHTHNKQCANTNWCLILMLLRKEVIHPHLPVRVPCYDFVPIADPTLDSSLTSLSHWLRVLPTFMT